MRYLVVVAAAAALFEKKLISIPPLMIKAISVNLMLDDFLRLL